MFAYLFASLFEFALIVVAVVVVYQVFLSDLIAAKRSQWKESKEKYSSMDKIAQVKLVSDDAKEIEKFVTDNAQFISNNMVNKLVERIEYLHADKYIASNEDTLKKRIADLPQQPEAEEIGVLDESADKKTKTKRK
jgi:hypothetical protein